MMKSRVLITGATGFVGPYLADLLLQKDYEVWGSGLPGEKHHLPDGVILRPLNLIHREELLVLLEECRPDTIYHLAAQSSVGRSWQNPLATMQVNLEGCINLLEAIRSLKMNCRVLLIGSGEEYGPVRPEELPIRETQLPDPRNPYSLSKLFQTTTGLYYHRNYGMKIYISRAFNHTGPGQGLGFVVPDFASQIAAIESGKQQDIIRVGNLSARRDFCDVRDVVKAYCNIVEQGKPGIIYNVGSGKAVSVKEILDKLLSLSRMPIEIEIDPDKFRPVDVPVIYGDITKIQEQTGWQPVIAIEDTLKDTLKYWRQELNEETFNPNETI